MSDTKNHLFRELFQRHSKDLLRFLTRRVGSQDAPDLLQETFLRVLRRTESEAILEPYAFLHMTALNLAKDHQRRCKTEYKHIDLGDIPEDVPAPSPPPEDRIDARRRLKLLDAAVQQLPPRCRQVFIMRRYEELPQREIARRLGISQSMVKQHMRLALQRFHEALD